jgi:uncharacterized phage-associated protein
MLMSGYDVAKAAQVAAYFAIKSGGQINVLKLSKLLYLAEREYMRRYDEPMFYDRLVSMPDGPVASITLNLINGNTEDEVWQRYIQPRVGYDVSANPDIQECALDELSQADVEVLNSLWDQFGRMGKYELRDWTHKAENIPEWEDPEGSSSRILHSKVFRLLGKNDPESLSRDIEEFRALKKGLRAEV